MTETAAPRRSPVLRALYLFWMVLVYVVCIALLAGVAAAVGGYVVYDHVTRPGYEGDRVEVNIPQGASTAEIGEILSGEGLLEYPWLMRAAAAVDARRPVDPERSGGTIKFGRYDLPKGLSPTEILYRLYEGPNARVRPGDVPDELRVSVPEGLSIKQIAATMSDGPAFEAAAMDAELIRSLNISATTLDGFLMPNTYFFSTKPSASDVVARMVEQFKREYAALVESIPGAADRDLLEVVTIASLIEEEARDDEERALVASVIYNRLKQGMPLQMDSTLQFVLNKYGQRMLDADKAVDSPYNSYKYPGLPPGPISNPGVASLRAALQPAESNYLYFVSNADGRTHTFSETLAEHNRARERYNQEIAVQRRELREAGSDGR